MIFLFDLPIVSVFPDSRKDLIETFFMYICLKQKNKLKTCINLTQNCVQEFVKAVRGGLQGLGGKLLESVGQNTLSKSGNRAILKASLHQIGNFV